LPNFLSSYVEKATYEAKIKELEDLITTLSAKITALEENKDNITE
jgi:exonuclease VII small subunit